MLPSSSARMEREWGKTPRGIKGGEKERGKQLMASSSASQAWEKFWKKWPNTSGISSGFGKSDMSRGKSTLFCSLKKQQFVPLHVRLTRNKAFLCYAQVLSPRFLFPTRSALFFLFPCWSLSRGPFVIEADFTVSFPFLPLHASHSSLFHPGSNFL